MVRYILRRLVASVALLIVGSMVVFLLMRVIPGDPTITKLGGSINDVDQATIDGIRAELGLDKSIPQQYVDWVEGSCTATSVPRTSASSRSRRSSSNATELRFCSRAWRW